MGNLISFNDYRQSGSDKWLTEVNVRLKARYSFTHLDVDWTPPVTARNFASVLPPHAFVEQFSKSYFLLET